MNQGHLGDVEHMVEWWDTARGERDSTMAYAGFLFTECSSMGVLTRGKVRCARRGLGIIRE